jgi:hypothetical protein
MTSPYLCVTIAVLLGWLAGCGAPASPEVIVEYRRTGGFAGLDDHLVVRADGETTLDRREERYEFELDSETMDRLLTALDNAELSQLDGEYLPSQKGGDLFECVVAYQGYTVRTGDTAVPESLWPALELLNQIVESDGKP